MVGTTQPKVMGEFYEKVLGKPSDMANEGEILSDTDEGGMWIATFADPDGNYFQLMSPWENDK